MIPLLRRLESHPRLTTWLALAGSAILGGLNYWIGWEVSFSVLYLIPIAPVAWVRGWIPALALSLACAAMSTYGSTADGFPAPHSLILPWNTIARFLFFTAVSLLLVSLREALDREAALARTDPLTGTGNSRAFRETTSRELERMRRSGRPFILIYLDLDGFKQVNDLRGHTAGDRLLVTIATSLRQVVRGTDFIARLGGDEFALLLPAADAEGARLVLQRISARLDREVISTGWPVTFSAGALVCLEHTADIDFLVQAADELMYEVKGSGKASFRIRSLSPANQ